MESDDYKNSVIYRIYCKNDIKDCYIDQVNVFKIECIVINHYVIIKFFLNIMKKN